MDINAIEKALIEIVSKREQLKKLDYSDPQYDELEDALHDLEDDFQAKYGEYMEDILQDVHDDICPDTDVLLPIAYLVSTYAKDEKGHLQVAPGEGVYVESDEYPGKDTKLALVPSPLRIVMNFGNGKQEVVWTADKLDQL